MACALMVLEVQRMPVARFVSFSMFAPLPYAVEAAAMLAIVVLYRVRGALRVSDLRAVRVTVALLSAAATWLLLYSPLADDGLALAALVLYRVATGLLLVLWGERLVPLGARRTACAFAAACLLSGLLTMVLALFSGEVARVLLGALPVAAGGLFVLYRPLVGKRRANDELDQPLPRFACSTLKDRVVAVSLVALPLLCRGPMVTSQSSPMKKSLYTVSVRPLSLRTTGMWTLSFLVPGLMMMSMPSLSFLVTMSMWAVVFRAADWPLARML